MAIKDWKKIGKDKFIRKKSNYPRRNEHLQIAKYREKDIDLWHTTNPYGSGGVHEKLGNFKTKSQALKYARAYMRKH